MAHLCGKCGDILAFTTREAPTTKENMWNTYQQTYPIIVDDQSDSDNLIIYDEQVQILNSNLGSMKVYLQTFWLCLSSELHVHVVGSPSEIFNFSCKC